MTQSIALIIHEVLDAPEHWRESDAGDVITNGYYKVSFDGTFYFLGSAKYQTTQQEKDSFCQAIGMWKKDTGWQPKEKIEKVRKADSVKKHMSMDEQKEKAYSEFVRSVRSSMKSFSVHKDSVILSSKIQSALDIVNGALRPYELTVGDKPDAKGSGISSA